jgi:hypothetical protein
MADKPLIIVGLLIGLGALSSPIWYALAGGSPQPPPQLEPPVGHSQCVRDVAYMRANHMDLLNRWRDEVVRQGDDRPVEIEGQQYPKSLTRGCLSCHTNRQGFCDKCHDYADVQPYCWNCHCEPKEI